MSATVEDVMTTNLITCDLSCGVGEAARAMRDRSIGDVLVMDGIELHGIVTDRDLTMRVIADGLDPETTILADVCAGERLTIAPDEPIEVAVEMMRDQAVRRLPVCVGNIPVGIVSLGDLALDRDRYSALAAISAAPPNS